MSMPQPGPTFAHFRVHFFPLRTGSVAPGGLVAHLFTSVILRFHIRKPNEVKTCVFPNQSHKTEPRFFSLIKPTRNAIYHLHKMLCRRIFMTNDGFTDYGTVNGTVGAPNNSKRNIIHSWLESLRNKDHNFLTKQKPCERLNLSEYHSHQTLARQRRI